MRTHAETSIQPTYIRAYRGRRQTRKKRMSGWTDYGNGPMHSAYARKLAVVGFSFSAETCHVFPSSGLLPRTRTPLTTPNPPPIRISPGGQSTEVVPEVPEAIVVRLPTTLYTFGFTAPPANLTLLNCQLCRLTLL
jgi:hypothetical protein